MADDAVVRQQLEPKAVPGRPLGRHVVHDARSRDFPAPRADSIVSVTHKVVGVPLNQGHTNSCTANALCGALNAKPNHIAGKVYDEKQAMLLYTAETQLEGKPYPANDPGGSGLTACQAARHMGWIRSYRHAFGIQHALEALVLRPVMTGVIWYSSFDTPDSKTGLVEIAPGAIRRGGHEILAYQIDADSRLVYLWNSWGPTWGIGGRFCWTFETWERLLSIKGDVTVPEV
jgi:hypothetical protein